MKIALRPVVAAKKPIKVDLEQGKDYYFCTCGRSKNQPFCDGSHQGTNFKPLKFSVDSDREAWLCQCKQSLNQPYCDGRHQQVPDDMVGKEFLLADIQTDTQTDNTAASKADEADEKERSQASDKMPEPQATAEEPTLEYIHELARNGLKHVGKHGPIDAMGVPRQLLPDWNDIQILTAQFATQPLLDETAVGSELVIGPKAKKPLKLALPLLVSDMSFGSLSFEAKLALAKGAELAGTGICSGEGGMLPEEQAACSRYLYEYASAGFGYSESLLSKVQAFHFKGGQAAKTGTGGHLPGSKNVGRIAEVRGLPAGQDAISPATFPHLHSASDFAQFANHVRELSGGIPVGFKLSAQHIERDIDFALDAGADYIILDGRGGGTGAAPLLFRDHISVPTIPALARARRHLDRCGKTGEVTLIITGGIRTPADFIKALALGADGVALANSAMQAIGCVGARICHTNLCPAGIATQDPALRARLDVDHAAQRLARFLAASLELMQVMARACGHSQLQQFNSNDLCAWKKELAELAGIQWAGA